MTGHRVTGDLRSEEPPKSRILCPLCARELQAEVALTAKLWRWRAMCPGRALDGAQVPLGQERERHSPALVEVSVRPHAQRR